MNNESKGLMSKIESFYERYPGENFGFAAVALLILTVGISIILYIQVDPTFSFYTHYVSGLGGPPKGAPEGIHYLSATIYNLGMLLAVPLRIAFLLQVIILVKRNGAGLWLSRICLVTGLISSTGWLLMALVPFSADLDLHMIGALVYFLGATSFQLTFALTELKTQGLPKHLPFLGLLNLVVFSAFSYQLIQVEVLQIPGIPEPAIYEWLVFASAILWVLAHGLYSLKARGACNTLMNMSDPKRKDRLFLFPALIVWILILITSFGNIQGPFYSLKSPMNVVGALIFLIGLAIRLSAVATLNRSYSWTLEIRDEHRLVKNGLYKYVRHPIYLGAFLGAFAVPVYATSLLGFLFALTAIPLFIYRMGVEEKMLFKEFGDEYREYMENTWRLIPFLY